MNATPPIIAPSSPRSPLTRANRGAARLQGLRKFAGRVRAGIVLVASTTVAVARSRQVHAAIRAVYWFVVDFAVVLSVAAAAVAILAAAFLLTAPPA